MFILRFTFKMCLTLFFVQNNVSLVEDQINHLVLNCCKCKRFNPLLTQYFTFREDVKCTSVLDTSCLCRRPHPCSVRFTGHQFGLWRLSHYVHCQQRQEN